MAYTPDNVFTFTSSTYTPDGDYNFSGHVYVDAQAVLSNTQSLNAVEGNYIDAQATLVSSQVLPADAEAVFNASSVLANAHSLDTVGTRVISAEATLSNGNTLSGDAGVVLNAQAILTEGHTINAQASDVTSSSSTLIHGQTLEAQATVVLSASATINQSQALTGLGQLVVNAQSALANVNTIAGTSTLVYNASATLDEGHTVDGVASVIRLPEALAFNRHTLYVTATGGTPVPEALSQDYDLDIAEDVFTDIDVPGVTSRRGKTWDISYNITGGPGSCAGISGINTAPFNASVINQCGGRETGLTELYLELNQSYNYGEPEWELTQAHPRVMDATVVLFELDQEYSIRQVLFELTQEYVLDSAGTNVREFELTQGYNIVSLDFVIELLGYVNDHRATMGLTEIEGVWHGQPEYDIAQIHSRNMAAVEIAAHNHTAYPVGWQYLTERSDILAVVDGHTRILENLQQTYSSTAAIQQGWDVPNLEPVTARELFEGWKSSPGHNANMLYDWEEEDHPLMAFGLDITNAVLALPQAPYVYLYEYATQLFLGYGIGDRTMIKIELGQTWDVAHGNIQYREQEYFLDAYSKARVQHETSYGITISTQHETEYTDRVTVQHEAPIHYTVSVQHETLYDSSAPVAVQHETSYDLEVRSVGVQHETSYGISVQAQHETEYSMLSRVSVQHEAPYGDLIYARAQHETEWDINSINKLVTSHSTYWNIESSAAYTPTEVTSTVTLDGVVIPIIEANVSSSEDRVLWSCRMILQDLAHYSLFIEGAIFTVDLQGEIYTFQYNTKSITRNAPGHVVITVDGLSPAMTLQAPRATNITKSYETSMLAQDIIEDILGQSVTWEFPAWTIPPNTIVADNAVPLDLAKKIIEVAGGLLESNIDGSLLVRKKYLVNTTLYDSITPDHVYTDTEDNLSVTVSYENREGYNRYRVTDSDPSYSDSLEFVMDEGSDTKGVVRAYPTPWRTTIEIITTDAGLTYLGNPLWVVRDEEALVEFVEGEASLPYIAESITSVVWHSDSLGGILHTAYESELTTQVTVNKGYGLATINYKVKCLQYDTVGSIGTPVQYIIADS